MLSGTARLLWQPRYFRSQFRSRLPPPLSFPRPSSHLVSPSTSTSSRSRRTKGFPTAEHPREPNAVSALSIHAKRSAGKRWEIEDGIRPLSSVGAPSFSSATSSGPPSVQKKTRKQSAPFDVSFLSHAPFVTGNRRTEDRSSEEGRTWSGAPPLPPSRTTRWLRAESEAAEQNSDAEEANNPIRRQVMQQAYGYLEAMRRACGPHAAVTKPSAHSSSSSSPVPTASPHTRWYALCFQVKQHVLGSLHALLPSPPIVPVVSCGASRAAAHPSRTPSPTSPSRFPPQTDPHDARAGGRPLSPGRPRLRVIPEEDVAAMGEPRKMDQGGVEEEPHTTDKNDTAAYPSRAPHSCRIPMETGGANEGGGDDRFSLKEVTVLLALYARVESEDGFLLRQLMHEVYRLAERKRQWMGHLAVPPVSEVDGCASSTAVGQADADEERDVSGTTMSVSSLLECSESGSTKTKRGGVGGGVF